MRVPANTVGVLLDLLEEQEDAIRTIEVHLSVGQDLSPPQLEAMLQLKRRLEETRRRLEAMIQGWRISDYFAQAGSRVADRSSIANSQIEFCGDRQGSSP